MRGSHGATRAVLGPNVAAGIVTSPAVPGPDGLVFAEKLLRVVADADHNSTYKMATALAVLQAAQEHAPNDDPPGLPVRRIAEIVLELYERQLRAGGESAVFRQMNRVDQSSRLLDAIGRLATHRRAGAEDDDGALYEAVVADVEDLLLSYPLRLLQTPADQFIYEVPQPTKRSRAAFGPQFQGRLVLQPGVLPLLQRAAPLLRPLIEGAWVAKVARYNAVVLDETRLRRQLFGYERVAWPVALRQLLEALQDGCFYCGRPLPRRTASASTSPEDDRRATHIDHFIAWSRTMNDAIENLVLADSRCNLRKSDYLCSPNLVDRWLIRLDENRTKLAAAATTAHWPSALARTLRTAAVQYEAYAPGDVAPAWNGSHVVSLTLEPAAKRIRGGLAELGPD